MQGAVSVIQSYYNRSTNKSNDSAANITKAIEIIKELVGNVEISVSRMQEVTHNVQNQQKRLEENAASTEETSASMLLLSRTIGECAEDTEGLVELGHLLHEQGGKFQL